MPCYHAREVAQLRATLDGARLLLGSATPSLETWLRCRQPQAAGGIQLLRLPERRPEYRASRAHADFLTPLSAHAAAAAAEAEPEAAPQLRRGGHDFHPGAAALFPHQLRALAASFRLVEVPLEEALSVAQRPQERVGTHYVDL